jgi:hypothetical protein
MFGRIRQQKAAIATIEKHAGSGVKYRQVSEHSSPGMAWLRRNFSDVFVVPVEAFVCDAEATQEVYDSLALLPTVECVRVRYGSVSATELAGIARNPNLHSLTISSELEPGALAALAAAKSLTDLELQHHCFEGDEALAGLSAVTSLERLDLQGSEITAAGLAHLVRLPHLEELNCFDCPKLDDAAIPILAQMKQLRTLNVEQTLITPAAAQRLQKELNLDQFKHAKE